MAVCYDNASTSELRLGHSLLIFDSMTKIVSEKILSYYATDFLVPWKVQIINDCLQKNKRKFIIYLTIADL